MDYSTLIMPGLCHTAEKQIDYSFLSERHIQAMWFEQKYFRHLKSARGEVIEVISPGIWNAEAGPDFLKAHLKIGSKTYRGDIEIHLNDSSWYQHQHHVDARYDQVVLHLSFWQPASKQPIKTKAGLEVVQAYLEPYLTIPPARIVQLIDLDLYPYKEFVGSGKCAQAVFRGMSEDSLRAFFRSAAEWRLLQKRKHLHAYAESPEWELAVGMAMALGYRHNAKNFLGLFSWLKSLPVKNEKELLAIALKACGLFDEKYAKRWNESGYYQELRRLAAAHEFDVQYLVDLRIGQTRPLNHPVRRLAVLIKLIIDPQTPQLLNRLLQVWSVGWKKIINGRAAKQVYQQLLELLPDYFDDYWNKHYHFEKDSTERTLSLMGSELKNTILLNAVFPLLYSNIVQKGDFEEIKAFQHLYEKIPGSKSGKSRYLSYRFFGETMKGKLLNQALMQQGAFQVHRDFCLHFEASCEGCPFVDRLKRQMKEV